MESQKRFQNFLDKTGIPYEKKLIQKHSDLILDLLRGENIVPYEIEIQPAARCNARCLHCFGKTYERCEEKLYDKKSMDRIINQVLGLEKKGFRTDVVKYCGSTGEPLMNPMTIYAIEKIYQQRFQRLFTNGILLGKNKDNDSYLNSISKINKLDLSLDSGSTPNLWETKPGAKKEGVRLEDILTSLNKIKKFSKLRGDLLKIETGYVITNNNYHEIIEAVEKVKNSGVDLIKFRIDFTDRSVSKNHGKEINLFLEEANKMSCEKFKVVGIYTKDEIGSTDSKCFSSRDSGFKCFTSNFWTCIGPDGNVYPCGHVVSKDSENYGSLLEQNFLEILESEKRKKVLESLPGKKCNICSPFSFRTNEFMTFLSDLPFSESKNLIKSKR